MNKSESLALKHYLWLNNLRGKQASGVFEEEHFSLIYSDSANLLLNFDLL